MTWDADSRTVAEPTGASVSGVSAAGGVHVHIDVAFRTVEWPWEQKGPVTLIPQPAQIHAKTSRGQIPLGAALPAPGSVVTPAAHSSTASVRYTLGLNSASLGAFEEFRDGRSFELVMTLVAHPLLVVQYSGTAPGLDVRPTSVTFPFKVPQEQWLTLLKAVGYCDTLLTELALPTTGPDATRAGRQRLVQAVSARNEGSYAETMRRCRIALDELKNAGFGGKAPSDVAKFLQERAGSLTQSERFSALQLALQLFLSPAHHANAAEEHYSRGDAELAIAVTAALLKLAPQHVLNAAEDGKTSDDMSTEEHK